MAPKHSALDVPDLFSISYCKFATRITCNLLHGRKRCFINKDYLKFCERIYTSKKFAKLLKCLHSNYKFCQITLSNYVEEHSDKFYKDETRWNQFTA